MLASCKMLVKGYFMKTFKGLFVCNLPDLILHLIVKLFYLKEDRWRLMGDDVIVTPDGVLTRVHGAGSGSIFLSNVVFSGVHVWRFLLVKPGYYDLIGIISSKAKMFAYHDLEYDYANRCSHFVRIANRIYRSQNIWLEHMGFCFVDSMDVISVILNFEHLKVYFRKNGIMIHQEAIESCSYKAGVSFSMSDAKIQFLEYKHIIR